MHLIFDKTVRLSVKDSERNKRDDNRHVAYQTTDAEQKRPSSWLQSLRVDQLKEALAEFLATFWESNELAFIIGSKKIFVNSGDTCFSFCNENGFMVKRIEEEYRCSHVEADSRMLFHPSKCSTPSNIVIRTIDADVIIIALGSLHLVVESKQVWIETGLVTKNTLRYINIKQIHDHFGLGFCTAFSRFHAFSGCDYTVSFNQ